MTILTFGTKFFGTKGISGLKQKNRFSARVHGCYLLCCTFPHWGGQTQQNSNVSFPSSRRDKTLTISHENAN